MTDDRRRHDDDRFGRIAKDIDEAREDFEYADQQMRNRYEPMYDWWQQTRGAWRLVLGTGVVLGIVGAFFGLIAYFRP